VKKILIGMLFSPFLLVGCNPSSDTPNSSDNYDYNWKKGDNALEDAEEVSIKNPKGDYSSYINQLRKSQNNSALPSKGEANILVVPIEFYEDSDSYKYSDKDLQDLKTSYFKDDLLNEEKPSVLQYYENISSYKLDFSGVVTPIITLKKSYAEYIVEAINSSYLEVKYEIMSYVYNYLFNETKTYYYADFDSDDDNKIDNIVLVYNYYCLEDDTGYSTSSSYVNSFFTSDTYLHSDFKSIENSSTLVNSFTFTSAKYNKAAYVDDDSNISYGDCDAHEYIKQVGLAMGLDEYIDRSGNSSSTYRSPLGLTDVMETGLGEHNPFSLYLLGYSEIKRYVSRNIEEEIIQLDTDFPTILLTNNDYGVFSEYLLISFYNPNSLLNSLDMSSPYYLGYKLSDKVGIRVYKIDARLAKKVNNSYYLIDGNVDISDGSEYSFAFSNDYVNPLKEKGIDYEFPLIELLKKDESNRHMLDSNNPFGDTDMFYKGDVFGDSNSISEFYYNFSFDGVGLNKDLLNISFSVDELSEDGATLKLWRH